jgi:hypothetical protein
LKFLSSLELITLCAFFLFWNSQGESVVGKTNILIVVKTYPEISHKYTETVCTAGVLADSKTFIRLYPIRFRYLEGTMQFKKYQWIRANITKATSDPRPESYHIAPDSIELGDVIKAGKTWEERCAWLLNENTVFPSVEALRTAQKNDGTSLGIVKPKIVNRVIIKQRNLKEVQEAIAKKDSVVNQLDLFDEKKDLYILPVRIMIDFSCNDPDCTGHKMSILDWEFGQLYRKVIKSVDWQEKIKSKIIDEIFAESRDTHIILGNMVSHPQSFSVLGFFWPPKQQGRQLPLFS